jgi:hypothetical protein
MSTLHINRPRYTHYCARWHRRGNKKYTVISNHRTEKAAIRALFKWVLTANPALSWNRADVMAFQEWYGWTQVLEVSK